MHFFASYCPIRQERRKRKDIIKKRQKKRTKIYMCKQKHKKTDQNKIR